MKSNTTPPGPIDLSGASVINHQLHWEISLKREATLSRLAYQSKKIAIYVSSLGNYFYNEIANIFIEGFKELGCEAMLLDENQGFIPDVDWHLVIAPHEFFYLGEGGKLRLTAWPETIILYNGEQPNLKWFDRVKELLSRAYAVWDINYESLEIIKKFHPYVHFVPPGFVKTSRIEVKQLPDNPLTASLDQDIKSTSFRFKRFTERPIDICFIGYLNDRRSNFFAKYATYFSKYNCFFYFWDAKQPAIPGMTTDMNTATAVGIIQRSKIILNLHQSDFSFFEWHRIVNLGISNETLVVSESCSDSQLFNANDFVSCELDSIPREIEFYLKPVNSNLAQNRIRSAYSKFTEDCQLKDILSYQMSKLYVC